MRHEQLQGERPRQDSNLRHRLRRAIRFVQPVLSVRHSPAEMASESSRSRAVHPVVLI